jgi:nucleoside-diphosphate-sugar epimerase
MHSQPSRAVAGACVLVTGATGFVGSRLMHSLGGKASALSTRSDPVTWPAALQGKSCVVHLAARVHLMQDTATDPMAEYRRVNVDQTLALARQASVAGVSRFVFISSVKVNGEKTEVGHPFRADDKPAPQDPYGVSKWEAEQGLRAIAKETGLEVVIIRPPLVYGPGVKANFASMVKWLQRGVPLPLGAIHNRRSLVALDNLVDLITTCISHPAAVNQTLMVSDGEDVSTTELLKYTAAALGRPARLLPVPQSVLEWVARSLGKPDMAQRLCSSLQVDVERTRKLLGWAPRVSLVTALSQISQYIERR